MNAISQENRITASLKLLLIISTLFILWSLLALCSSIYQPFSEIDVLAQPDSTSATLVDSLFLEIVRSYFSLFTMSVLGLILLAVVLGYGQAKGIANKFFPIHIEQSPLSVFLKRIFTFKNKQVMALSSKAVVDGFDQSEASIFGPATVQLNEGKTALITDEMGNFRLAAPQERSLIWISRTERLIKLLDLGIHEVSLSLKNSPWNNMARSINISYRLRFPDHNGLLQQYINTLGTDLEKIHDILGLVLNLEFDILLRPWGVRTDTHELMENPQEILLSEGDPNIHTRSAYLPSRTRKNPSLIRNRRRIIYPLGSSNPVIDSDPDQNNEEIEKIDQIMREISNEVNRTLTQLFGFLPIEIIDYQIGGQL